MALSTAIYTLLSADATISAAFGTRIYAGIAPMEVALPCIVFDIASITPDYNQTSDSNWDTCQVTVAVISTKYSTTETYAVNVRTALSRYSGTVDTEKIEIKYDNEASGYDPDFTVSASATGVGVFVRNMNFTIFSK